MPFTALQFVQNSKQSNSFVGVFRYIKTSGVKSLKDGELYGFLEISSEGDFPAERVAHMAWDGVVEGYMYSQSKSISDSLKSGIAEFTRRLKDLMRNSKELEVTGIEVSLTILSATKEGVYVANLGENEMFVYRGEKIVDIVDVLEKNNAQTAGFPISEKDMVIMGTKSLLSENMHTLLGKKSKEDIVKSLTMLGKTLTSNQGLFCVYLEKDKEEEKLPVRTRIPKRTKENTEKDEEVEDKGEGLFKKESPLKEKRVDVKAVFGEIKGYLLVLLGFFERIFLKISKLFKKIYQKAQSFVKSKVGNKRWFKKYSAKASEISFKKRSSNIRIDGYKTKNLRSKRFKIVILATLAVVVAVGGYQYARKQKTQRELHNRADEILENINRKVESAKSNLSTDTEEAETDIFAANNLFEEIPDGINEEYLERKGELEKAVLGVEDTLYKRVEVTPESFVGFFDEGTELTDLEYVLDDSGNELLIVTDKGTSSVWQVSIYDRSKSRMADNEGLVSSPEYVDIGNEGNIFVYDSDVGVLRASKASSGWGAFEKLTGVGINNIGINEVGEFAVLTSSDNLYYLDISTSRIMKSVNYGTGYSSTTVSVINDERFSNANDFFADFSIYVLTSGSEGVLRYSAGNYVPITVVGVNGEIGELTCGDTSGNMDYALYMYDKGGNRILRMEKPKDSYNDKLHPNELHLLNQYIYRGDDKGMWENVRDIAIDRAEKYLFILDGNNVWRIGL